MKEVVLNCEECELCLLDLLEGKLSVPEQQEVEAHLADCPHCQQRKEEFSMTLETYGFSERPSPGVRMAIYEAAREEMRTNPRLWLWKFKKLAWGRHEARYAWAALFLVGIGFLLKPLWHRAVSGSKPEIVGAISLPPPPTSEIKVEYLLQDSQGKSISWILDNTKLRWLGPTDKAPFEVTTSDVDKLIRDARHLNLLPIPMLTKEPRSCAEEESSELVILEFEGRKLKARLCSQTHENEDRALREFVKVFKRWTDDHTNGSY